MAHTEADVVAAVEAVFPRGDTKTILAVLDLYGTAPHEREANRVKVAIVQLSQGSEDKLLELVQTAKTDYRDILSWVETGPLSPAEGEKLQLAARKLLDEWGKK